MEQFHSLGYSVVGVDNDLRGKLLGDPGASTLWNIRRLEKSLRNFFNFDVDIRSGEEMEKIIKDRSSSIRAIIHAAAQPAHEGKVVEDYFINAVGTVTLLDLWKRYCPDAVFIYVSTIKVYANYPNTLEYERRDTRFDLSTGHRYFQGFDETVSIDQGMSSFFGRSKTAADLYVQEYVYQYGLKAVCFRASCLTGGNHSGGEAHGMLSYMMRCAVTGKPYRVYGYEGLQVRDQLHARDLVSAFIEVLRSPGENVIYNIGGGRENACSVLEAISQCEGLAGRRMDVSFHEMRKGDHIWWVTDSSRFKVDHPAWKIQWSLRDVYADIYERGKSRW